jgi:hypothetical protein
MAEFDNPPVVGDSESFGLIDLVGATSGTVVLTARVVTDVVKRYNMTAAGSMSWGDGTNPVDIQLTRDAAGVLAQRVVGQAQAYRVYNQYVDGSNYSRFVIDASAGLGTQLRQEALGSGNNYNITISTTGSTDIVFNTGGSDRWTIDGAGSTGHLLPSGSNTKDIGKATSGQIRSLYFGTQTLGPNGLVGTPSYSFENETNTGLWRSGSSDIRFSVAGTDALRIQPLLFSLPAGGSLAWGSSGVTSADVILARDSAGGRLALKNGANAQLFRVYGTTTGPLYIEMLHDGSNAYLRSNTGGGHLYLGSDNTARWFLQSTTGHFGAQVDNTFDIGASGATRPRTIYPGTSVTFDTAGVLAWSTDLFLRRSAANVLSQSNTTNAQTYYLYNTTDSDSTPVNYERTGLVWTGNVCYLLGSKGGTGVQRNVGIGISSVNNWQVTAAAAHWITSTDNVQDIGASGATRPRTIYPGTSVRFDTAGVINWNNTVFLRYAASDILAQSRTTNAQSNYLYETTDSDTTPVNYGRMEFTTAAGGYNIQATIGGTGTGRSVSFGTGSANTSSVLFVQSGSTRWIIQASGHWVSNSDNALDFGTAGANRVRTIYVGTSIVNYGAYLGLPTGCVSFATAAQATNATTGWLTIPSCAGTPTGVPANVPTGQVAMTYDSTNNKVYVYNGGWKRAQVTAVDAIYA